MALSGSQQGSPGASRRRGTSVEVLEDGVVMHRSPLVPGAAAGGAVEIAPDGTMRVAMQGRTIHTSVPRARPKDVRGRGRADGRTVRGLRTAPRPAEPLHAAAEALTETGWLPAGDDRDPWLELAVEDRLARIEVSTPGASAATSDGAPLPVGAPIDGAPFVGTVRVCVPPGGAPVRVTLKAP